MGLGLVEDDDGHKVYGWDALETGRENLHRGHGGGVFNKTMAVTGELLATLYSLGDVLVDNDVVDNEND